jgi:hypothetical protein
MAKTAPMLATALLALAVQAQVAPVQTTHNKVFLLGDDGRKEWCAYASDSLWKERVASTGAATVATMTFSNARLTSVEVTTEDEAGDWMVFDHYTLSAAGDLENLRRRYNILPGDRSVSETYLFADGKAKLQNRETTSLTTGEKLTAGEKWLPEVRFATRLKDFPFAPLTMLKYSDVLSKGKICAPGQTPR